MPALFDPLAIRDITLRNRIVVSPMCQYSSDDGFANDWHFVHLGGLAVGGASLVFAEATAVTPQGRISPQDLGLWKDEHVPMLDRITGFVSAHGAVPGIQLAHAGRKGSTFRPWEARKGMVPEAEGGWQPVAPSPIRFAPDFPLPAELTEVELAAVVAAFGAAAARALAAGFQVVEIHGAHGYLVNEFLSPATNRRSDRYGGSFDNRIRLLLEIVAAIRAVWPERLPLFTRLSVTDWAEDGWTVPDTIELVRRLRPAGVDLIDCSSGGNVSGVRYPIGPGYQVAFSERVRRETGSLTGAVGMITEPAQADQIIRSGQADVVLLARELLRNPRWPLQAGRALGSPAPWPSQYLRAAPAPGG
jgi:2,4-dienoyl-CoA reductase-like NADH-dependent reductase (Old Yellow Enzyme family)